MYLWCGYQNKWSWNLFLKGVPLFASVPYKGFLRYNVHVNCNRLGTYWAVWCGDLEVSNPSHSFTVLHQTCQNLYFLENFWLWWIITWGDGEFVSCDWENLMSFLSVVLSYIYISTIFYNILLCQSSQGYGYIWQVKGYKILCHFINMADKWCLVDGQQFWMWFGTFTHTCTAPQGMVVGNCHLQGRKPSPWGRSPVSFEQIGPDSLF